MYMQLYNYTYSHICNHIYIYIYVCNYILCSNIYSSQIQYVHLHCIRFIARNQDGNFEKERSMLRAIHGVQLKDTKRAIVDVGFA